MVEQDKEQKERQLTEALGQAYTWISDWHQKFLSRYRLTPYLTFLSMKSSDLIKVADEASYLVTVRPDLPSDFGKVSVIELGQMSGDNRQPLMARFFYKYQDKDYKLVAISFGWRILESAVVYEMVSFASGQIDRLVKMTRAGLLFEAPANLALNRNSCQALDLDFDYKDGGAWFAKLGFERDQLGTTVDYQDGNVVAAHGFVSRDEQGRHFYIKDGQQYSFPLQLDPIPHLQNILRNNNPSLLL